MFEIDDDEAIAIVARDQLLLGDCREILATVADESVDLIVTSPPYADSRKATYGGVHPDDYVEWFAPIGVQLQRVLKADGTFILNIKEKALNGERHPYVLELILALRKQGWLWTEEYIWHKKNCAPGKWPNRFRDAWERCLQFNKQKQFKMFQDDVMVPTGDWAKSRLKNLSDVDQMRDTSRVGLFSAQDDLVLDPFAGSGTTCLAAHALGRHYLGIELNEKYFEIARENLAISNPTLGNDTTIFSTRGAFAPALTKRNAPLK